MSPGMRRGLPWGKFRSVAAYGAGPALGLLSGPILARALDPEGRGQFAAIMQPITVAGAIAALGIPSAVTFYVAKGRMSPKEAQNRALLAAIPSTLLVLGGMLVYALEVARRQAIPLWALLLAWSLIAASVLIQIRRGVFNGTGDWRRLDRERLSFAVLRFAVVSALALAGITSALHFAAGALGAFLLAALLLWLPPARSGLAPPPRVRAREFTQYSLAASVGTITVVSNNRLDQILLPLQTTNVELGLYAIAVTVAEVPMIFATLAARNAIREAGRGESLKSILKDVGLYLTAGTAAALVLGLGAPWYVELVFGISFGSSVASVQILTLGTVCAIGSVTISSILSGRGRPGVASIIPMVGLIVTITFFTIFWGQLGATEASAVAATSQAAALFAAIVALASAIKQTRKL